MPRPPSTPPGPDRRLVLLRLSALAAGIAAAFALLAAGGFSAARVRNWVDDAGPAAPVAFVAVSASLTVVLFPGPLLAGAAGLLFGTALGFPLALCSAVLGASAACTLSRRAGGPAIAHALGPRLLALRDWLGRRGFLAVLYARLLPGMPFGLVNYAAGLTAIPLRTFAAATALAAAPRAFAYVALGGSLDDLGSPVALAAIGVLVAMGLAGAVVALRARR